MPVKIILGAQWGDEGKGKIVDLLSQKADMVARYQGGANAGHTVCFEDKQYVLHLIPSGILHPGVICLIGNGVVVDPVAFFEEVEMLERSGISVSGRLFISPKAHLIFPYHILIDQAKERYMGENKVGTTKRGIGPAYLDKIDRVGIRVVDTLDLKTFRRKLEYNITEKNKIITAFGSKPLDVSETLDRYLKFGEMLRSYVADTYQMLNAAIAADKNILLEGAQGTLLDVDHGTYPFVTSSNATSGGACTGLGVAPNKIDDVMGIIKAYTTRVGNGSFPTEFEEEFGNRIRELGAEFGATTGRPRRCGWLDAVALRYAVAVNGINEIALTKLDVLDTIEEIKVCTAYSVDGELTPDFMTDAATLDRVEPVYQSFPGWCAKTTEASRFGDLPQNARSYVEAIEEMLGARIKVVSVGQQRERTVFVQ